MELATSRLPASTSTAAASGLPSPGDGSQSEAEQLLRVTTRRLSTRRAIADHSPAHGPAAERDPSELPWLIHLVILREQPAMIGDIGFHSPPDPRGFVEIGYTICEEYRGQGFATEAAIALARWAGGQPNVRGLQASVAPTNVASLRLVSRLGLAQVGTPDGRDRWQGASVPGANSLRSCAYVDESIWD